MTLSDLPGYKHTKTSDDYTVAYAMYPNGTVRKGNSKKSVLMDASQAQAALSGGKVAYVAPDVYEQIKQQGNG